MLHKNQITKYSRPVLLDLSYGIQGILTTPFFVSDEDHQIMLDVIVQLSQVLHGRTKHLIALVI